MRTEDADEEDVFTGAGLPKKSPGVMYAVNLPPSRSSAQAEMAGTQRIFGDILVIIA